jgi:O-antigen/teichoic acid export membrane protein
VDVLRETAPFLVGMLVPPLVMLVTRPNWSGKARFLAAFLPALVLGFCTSYLAGELLAGMPDGLIAVIIDTSLVFTGGQLTYRFIWKPLLESRSARLTDASSKLALRRVRSE